MNDEVLYKRVMTREGYAYEPVSGTTTDISKYCVCRQAQTIDGKNCAICLKAIYRL